MVSKIFSGAPIYTADEEGTVAEAVVVTGGKIEYVASDSVEALNLYPDSELVQVNGGCILPGFVDAHLHLRDFALLYRELDLSAARDKSEVLEGVKDAAAKKKSGAWLSAGGLSNTLLESLSRNDLDLSSPEVPVILHSRDMHSSIANSLALLKAGIDESRSDPLGGKIEKDGYGLPNGILRERAIELVTRSIPEERARAIDVALERGVRKLLSFGITTFCDCSPGTGQSALRGLLRLAVRGRIPGRTVVMLGEGEASKLGEIGIPSWFGNDRFRIGGLKVIIDGSLSSLTGYMSKPYLGTGSYGMLLMNEEELYGLLKKTYSNHIWAAVHCIGDKANEIALNVFQRLADEKGVPSLLRRIEHAQSLQDEDMERFASLGVVAVVNPNHIPLDREKAIRHLGLDARFLYRFKSLLSSGATIAFSSDAPVASINPFHLLYCAVERKDFREGPELRFYPKERISLQEALRACTFGGAQACGMGQGVGSIEVGKAADLVHVSRDIFRGDTDVLSDTEVLATYVDGQMVYEKKEGKK
jgi:predicted amidohydrolase YtcJ